MHIHFMFAYVYLQLHLFVIPLIYWNAHFKYIKKDPVTRCNFPGKLQRNSTLNKRCKLVTNVWYVKTIISKLWWKRVFANFTFIKSRIALQVGRKIAPCDRALIHVCLAYLFLHSGQVLSSFKCYFKRKYLNLIDSNCDVDESCPWFFIGTVLATGPKCIVNIQGVSKKR